MLKLNNPDWKKRNAQSGFSIIEILLASALAIMIIPAIFTATLGAQSSVVGGETNNEATAKAQQVLENEQALARQDFNLVNATTTIEKVGSLTYTKQTTVTLLSDFMTKQVTAIVSWFGDHNQPLSVKLTTLVTNLENVNSSNTCSSVLTNPNGWKSPQAYTFDFNALTPHPNNGEGFAISDLAVLNKRLYVTVSTPPNNYLDTVFVLSLPDDPSQAPVYLGSIDNDATGGNKTGPNAITVASTTNKIYAYVANASSFSKGQLQIIDVTRPLTSGWAPTITTLKIGTTFVPTAGLGKSIFYKDGYVYLGLTKTSAGGDEFNIIDVGGGGAPASPSNPIWKGGYAVGNDVNAIVVRSNYAYIVSPNNENMTILDISTPTNPVRVGGYTAPGPLPDTSDGVGSDHGESVYVVGTTAYLGRTYGTKEFYILDATTPSSLSLIGSKDIGSGNQTNAYGLTIRDYLAFIITNGQFQVWNISDPANMYPWTIATNTTQFLSFGSNQFLGGGSGTASDCEQDYLYLALASIQGHHKDIISIIAPGP